MVSLRLIMLLNLMSIVDLYLCNIMGDGQYNLIMKMFSSCSTTFHCHLDYIITACRTGSVKVMNAGC